MMDAVAILKYVREKGYTIRLDGDRLAIAPHPPAKLLERIRARKAAIIAQLAACAAEWEADEVRPQTRSMIVALESELRKYAEEKFGLSPDGWKSDGAPHA